MKMQSYGIGAYATLLVIGGIIGFVKAGSIPSIVFAALFALLLYGCAYKINKGSLVAYNRAIYLLAFLLIFFSYRFLMTYKMMPAGMMVPLTFLACLALLLSKNSAKKQAKITD